MGPRGYHQRLQLATLVALAFAMSACGSAPALQSSAPAAVGSVAPTAPARPPGSETASASVGPSIARDPGTTIALDANPVGAVGAPSGIWLWDDYSSLVVHLDAVTNTVRGTIAVGDPRGTKYGSPKVVATDGVSVWTADVATHAVLRIDPRTDTIADRILLDNDPAKALPAAVEPFGLAVSGDDLWVSDFDNGVVVHVDTDAKWIVDAIAVDHPEGVAVAFGSVWVVEHRRGNVLRIDPVTKGIVRIVIPGTGDNEICGMCIDKIVPSRDSIWVPLNLGRGVARIDPATNSVRAIIPMRYSVVDLSVAGDRVWVVGSAVGPVPCLNTDGLLAEIAPASETYADVMKLSCAASVATLDGDVWLGTVDAPSAVVHLSRP